MANVDIFAQRDQEKKRFVNDMYLTAGIDYWGDIMKNFPDDQEYREYDAIPQSYTIIDMDYEGYNDEEETLTLTPDEFFDKFYEYAQYLIKSNYENADINRYFINWAKNVIAFDLDEAACSADASVADCAVQYAMFGKQKYA